LPRARLALIGSGVMVIFQFSLFLIIGLALWGFYGGVDFARTDEIFATFLVEGLPPGLSGLVIAAIFAAAMSTLSSSLNALASSATYDIYAPLRGGEEGHLLRVGRWFTLMWAVVLVGGATVVRGQDTPVVELGLAIASFTYGGLLGAFLLGLLVRRAVQRDAIIAMSVGMTVMTVVVFAGWWASLFAAVGMHGAAGALEGFAGTIAWPWHVVIGSLLTLTIGTLASLLPARRRAEVGR
jgi:solute:Na+ symporter, SSS family